MAAALPENTNPGKIGDSTPDYENDNQVDEEYGPELDLNGSAESVREEDVGIECAYAEEDVEIRQRNTQVAYTKSKKKNRGSKYDEDNYCLADSSESETDPRTPSRPSPSSPSNPPPASPPQAPAHEGVRAFTKKKKSQKSNEVWKWTQCLATITCIVAGSLVIGAVVTYFVVPPKVDIPGVYIFCYHYVYQSIS